MWSKASRGEKEQSEVLVILKLETNFHISVYRDATKGATLKSYQWHGP